MRKSIPFIAGAVLLAGAGIAGAQTTTTTTTWTNDQGTVLREYSTSQHYPSSPATGVVVGSTLPGTVTVYPLPGTIKVQTPERYNYAIINNNPVVVERENRRVVHVWP